MMYQKHFQAKSEGWDGGCFCKYYVVLASYNIYHMMTLIPIDCYFIFPYLGVCWHGDNLCCHECPSPDTTIDPSKTSNTNYIKELQIFAFYMCKYKYEGFNLHDILCFFTLCCFKSHFQFISIV